MRERQAIPVATTSSSEHCRALVPERMARAMTQPLSDRELRELLEQATPGPWDADELFIGSENYHVADAVDWRGFTRASETVSYDSVEFVTNARLIAAAPALAEEVLRLREAQKVADYKIDRAIQLLNGALTRATLPRIEHALGLLRHGRAEQSAALQEGSA